MNDAAQLKSVHTDVFVSYSRKDRPFVRRLFNALIMQQQDIWVDWESIPYSAEWWKEIAAGIENANTFLIIISPNSLASEVCNREIHYALQLNKRIVPIIRQPVHEPDMLPIWNAQAWGSTAVDNWNELKKLNWLFFRKNAACICTDAELEQFERDGIIPDCDSPACDEDDFATAFKNLLAALETNQSHVRQHTRLLTRAIEWDKQARNASFLLRGDDLVAAENWLASGIAQKPPPHALHHDYILNSRRAAIRRQRTIFTVGLAAFVVMLLLSIVSLYQYRLAEENAQIANANAITATIAQGEAQFSAGTALAEADQRATQQQIAQHNAITATIAQGAAQFSAATAVANEAIALAAQETALAEADQRATQQQIAQHNAITATIAQGEALFNAGTAVANAAAAATAQDEAETNLFEAWRTQSLFLANLSLQESQNSNPQAALLLALEALSHYDVGLVNLESTNALRTALANGVRERFIMPHQNNVLGAQWSQDENRILTWSVDSSVRVWDAHTGEELLRLFHNTEVRGATWNHDSTRILSWAPDGTARVWDAATGNALLTFTHIAYVNVALWTPDEQHILTVDDDGNVFMWDAETGAKIRTLVSNDEFPWYTQSLLLSPDGHYAVTETINGFAQVLNLVEDQEPIDLNSNNEATWSPNGHYILSWGRQDGADITSVNGRDKFALRDDQPIYEVGWLPDNERVFLQSERTVTVWNVAAEQKLFTLNHDTYVNGVLPSPDGQHLLSWTDAGTIHIWNSLDGTAERVLEHGGKMMGVLFSPDETQMISWANDGTFKIWDAASGQLIYAMRQDAAIQEFDDILHIGAQWSHDGQSVLTWSDDNTARVWDLNTGAADREILTVNDDPLYSARLVTWNQAQTQLLVYRNANDDCAENCTYEVLVYDIGQREPVLRLPLLGEIWGASWNADASKIMSWSGVPGKFSSTSGEVVVWDVATGARELTLPHEREIGSAIWNPTETQIMTFNSFNIGLERAARVWDVQSGKLLFELADPNSAYETKIEHAQWSPDKKLILAQSEFYDSASQRRLGKAYIWDAATGDLVTTLKLDYQPLVTEWNGDGTRILTRGRDYECNCEDFLNVWDVATGQALFTFPLDGAITGTSWSKDGSRLLVWGGNPIFVLDSTTGANLFSGYHNDWVNGAVWSADETQILSWSDDFFAAIWDVATGDVVRTFNHPGELSHGMWDASGRYILTTSNALPFCDFNCTYSAWIWDAATGAALLELPHTGFISQVAWADDQRHVLTWTNGVLADQHIATFYRWLVDVPALIDLAQQRATREFTNTERSRFFLPTQTPAPTFTPAPTLEPNILGDITPGQRAAGQLEANRLDLWVFTGYVGQNITIRAESAADTILELILYVEQNPDASRTIASNDDFNGMNPQIGPLQLTDNGTYVIVVSTYGGVGGHYNIQLDVETIATATPQAIKQAQLGKNRGELTVAGGAVWEFTGQAGSKVAILVEADAPANTATAEEREAQRLLDTYVIIYAPDGTILAEADDIEGGIQTNTLIQGLELPSDGVYRIEVRSWGNLTGGGYTLTFNVQK